jgi:hypothetical protein
VEGAESACVPARARHCAFKLTHQPAPARTLRPDIVPPGPPVPAHYTQHITLAAIHSTSFLGPLSGRIIAPLRLLFHPGNCRNKYPKRNTEYSREYSLPTYHRLVIYKSISYAHHAGICAADA